MKSLFEELGGTYRREGDYLLPNVSPPESPRLGFWGEYRRKFLRQHHEMRYTAMLLSGTLEEHLASVDRDAEQMTDRLIRRYEASEGVTEALKADDPMEWVRRENSIRSRVREIVMDALICH
ncbi:MAG: TnpV protein [Candidatus Faecousia sp.]|nr:TnpV protein [Clostridiales bacterium]MDD7341241.1 TnpV protein [Bacillota bacterium]MDY2809954.1 TnpV protein [Candidatus Faecousia sp.]